MPSSAVRALLITLGIQAFVALASVSVPVLSTEIARDLGLSTALLGFFVSLLYASSMFAGLIAGALVVRFGAIRVSQVAVLFGSLGLLAATGPLVLLVTAALLMGVAYGAVNPASSHILIRTAPRDRVALTFSLKQTGVPLGAALAGALMPTLALTMGWSSALVAVAVAGVLIAALAQTIRAGLDDDRKPDHPVSLGSIVAPLRAYLVDPGLRELGRTGAAYAITQSSVMSFLVVFLSVEAGMSLVAAGLSLTVLNAFAVAGRIVLGSVADRWVAPKRLLGWLGMLSGVCGFLMTGVGAGWPPLLVMALCGVYGATAIGWNGIFISVIARSVEPARTSAMTGAGLFVTFSGVLIGPSLFGVLAGALGSFRPGFAALGVISLLNGLGLAWRYRNAAVQEAAGKG